MINLSVILPSRNEFPNIVHTCYSILHSYESSGFDPKTIELIIVDNCSDDNRYPQRGTGGTTSYLEGRGGYFNRTIRILRDPIAGNHSARNKGAAIARGKYLFFSDAHMAYNPTFFKSILNTVDESGGLVHSAIGWMGAYPPTESGLGYSYTIKLGEEWKGTWNNYKLADSWWYIPSQGHCSVAVRKDQFFKLGGYPKIHRTYGGGEFYIDMKWWMLGSTVATDPNAIGYHLASGRGYTYHHDDYIHNVLNCAYALGCDDWRERSYLNWMRNGRKETMDRIMQEGEVEMAADRRFVQKKRKMTFNDLLVKRPWDALNDRRHGKHNGAMSVFHWSWLELLQNAPEHVRQAYKNSQYQKGLAEFIEKNLSPYVYKSDKYNEEKRKELRRLFETL
ncbi:glycosyltransferase [Candidatus Roizmanbacteria bacterium]|nr:glycosyltransferase [Candidatus Roizmanbacteria bacterium]